jgi:FAD:protein FMN transferase
MKYNGKALAYLIGGIIIVIFAFMYYSPFKQKKVEYIHNEGKAQGTYYSATYQQPDGKDLQKDIEKLFSDFDLSLSTYVPNSIISKINNNDSVLTDENFEAMYNMAREVSEKSNGAFDITVAPLVNAWGFGFKTGDTTHLPDVDKLLPLIGYKKIQLLNHRIIKDDPRIMLDASALAQGLSADLIANLFEKNGCQNYMIDIGGEIACKGVNPDGKNWRIGIDKPIDDPANVNEQLQAIISISNVGLTTSGNYRKFYYKGGRKYAHTIDPRTGYPVNHNLLSATVIAPTSMQADAYATTFMVVGVDSAMSLCKSIPNMDCYLIYTDDNGKYQVKMTEGFKKYIVE